MRKIALELEHRYKNHFVARHIFSPGDQAVLGSAQGTDILLLGERVSGIHANLEYRDDGWVISDLASEQGTWVQKNPIVEHAIRSETEVHIGSHSLRFKPRLIERHLFLVNDEKMAKDGEVFHQVVVRKSGVVNKTYLLRPSEEFVFTQKGSQEKFSPPKDHAWVNRDLGVWNVQQRLVKAKALTAGGATGQGSGLDNFKPAALIAGAVVLIVLALLVFAPHKPSIEAPKMDQNIYTKMIYDSKILAKAKQESLKQKRNLIGGQKSQSTANAPKPGEAPKADHNLSASGAKVVNQLKSQQLSQLIGRISKRASSHGIFVAGQGKAPDEGGLGRAGDKAHVSLGEMKNTSSDGYRLGAVATAGRGGGHSQYHGSGSLSTGNVGNASVGILEEETEVEGGLDREVISKVIQTELGQIRYCYERQLSATPDLYGKIQVKFTIGSEGKVVAQSIGSTSVNNAMVEGCILRRIAGWQFPKPKGGTQVIVSYPFLFKSTR